MPADPNGLIGQHDEVTEPSLMDGPYPKPSLATRRELERRLLVAESGVPVTQAMPQMEGLIEGIPARFESQFYKMTPKTVDIVFEGTELRNGMVVLIEDHTMRENLDRALQMTADGAPKDAYALRRAEEVNRWCRISNVKRNPPPNGHLLGRTVSFIAEYADGTKIKRTYGVSCAWYVRIESLMTCERDTPK